MKDDAHGRSRRLLTALVATVLTVPLVAASEPGDSSSAGYVASDEFFDSADGTRLHARVFRPDGVRQGTMTDVIVIATPYRIYDEINESTGDGVPYGYSALGEALEREYTVVEVSLRGYGHSEGCGDFGGAGEQADVTSAVEWAASRSWSTGRVAMFGLSYDAWTQVMALASDPPGLKAVVMGAPLVSAYRGLYMDRAPYTYWARTVVPFYAAHDLASGPLESGVPSCIVESALASADPDPTSAFWAERHLAHRAATSNIPVLWSHGFDDLNVKPDHLVQLWPRLQQRKQAWLGQFPHQLPDTVDGEGFAIAALDWIDHRVRGEPIGAYPRVRVQDSLGRWRFERAWPPEDSGHHTLTLLDGTYRDVPGNTPWGWAPEEGLRWTFTRALPHAVHMSGTPRVELDVATTADDVQTVVHLFDVDVAGTARLVSRTATRFPTAGQRSLWMDLLPQDWVFLPGHRIGVLISGSDEAFIEPSASATMVRVRAGALHLPSLRFARQAFVEGQAPVPRPDEYGPDGLFISNETIQNNTSDDAFPPPMRVR